MSQVGNGPSAPVIIENDDDRELRLAFEAAQAEEAGLGQPAAQGAGQPVAQAPTGGEQEQPRQAPMIPKARLDEVSAKVRERDAQLLALQAENAALKAGRPATTAPAGTTPTQAAPAADTVDSQIAAVRGERRALAKRYDSGELSYEEMLSQQEAHDDRLAALAEERLLSRIPKSEGARTDALYLDRMTAEIEQANPYMEHVAPDDLEWIVPRVQKAMAAEGFVFDGSDRSRLDFRQRVAQEVTRLGPSIIGALPTPAGAPGTAPAATPPLSLTAQQRLDKMDLRAIAPVPVDAMIGGTGGAAEFTDARLESMSLEEIADLPPAVLARLQQTG